jgi:tRNA dimethylallyltransferase
MQPVIAIVGATATGKSALALGLARELDGEIVNADALQVYRGLDLGTAKPTLGERAAVPHHLLDILAPSERCSAGELARRAAAAIAELRGRGRRPIVVGGSGLYLRALRQGVSAIPPTPEDVRAGLARRLAGEGLAALRGELAGVDPATAARLAAGDTQRILRALEVFAATGRPLSDWHRDAPTEPPVPGPWTVLGLAYPREALRQRIAKRVDRMLAAGWIEEVAGLLARGTPADCPAFQAIGYRQIVEHLGGRLPAAALRLQIVTATAQYAKRQETWFRREPGVRWLAGEAPEAALAAAMAAARASLEPPRQEIASPDEDGRRPVREAHDRMRKG